MSKKHQDQGSNPYILVPLMLTIVIEVMGAFLIFPLFPALFVTSDSVLIAPEVALSLRQLFYGISLAMWPIGAFFGTPYLGELSDRFGRKKILISCLLVTSLSYVIGAISIVTHSVWLFLFARLLSGFFGGSYDIAQAATADISLPEVKARNMGLVTLAVSAGFVLGPAITSFTSSSHIFHGFSLSTPFWIAFGLALFNASGVTVFLKETYRVKKDSQIRLSKVFFSFLFIFTDVRVMRLGVIFLLLNIGWGIYIMGMPLILNQVFHFNVQFIGLFYCVLGLGFAFSILLLQPRVLKMASLKYIYVTTAALAGIILMATALYPSLKKEWISVFVFGILEILSYSSLLALTSNAVTTEEQGKVMGGLGALLSIGLLCDSFLFPWLNYIKNLLPILVAGLVYFISAILMVGKKEK